MSRFGGRPRCRVSQRRSHPEVQHTCWPLPETDRWALAIDEATAGLDHTYVGFDTTHSRFTLIHAELEAGPQQGAGEAGERAAREVLAEARAVPNESSSHV
jgi:hypothetical protein